MTSPSIPYVAGLVFEITAVIGIFLNIVVLLAIYKGRMLSASPCVHFIVANYGGRCSHAVHPPQRILSANTAPGELCFKGDLLHSSIKPYVLNVCDGLMLYCWYHNSLSHILVALNRVSIIVFERLDIFTRKRTIILCIIQHLIALILSAFSQFLLPCCRMDFSWKALTYHYNTIDNMRNYSNELVDQPLDTISSVTSMISYSAIVKTMIKYRSSTAQLQGSAMRKYQEYRIAIQFATMAFVYSAAWILFRVFPYLIGDTDKLYVYGVITFLVEMNSLTNAVVYLVNNKEIKKSLRMMAGNSASVNLSKMNTVTMVGN